MIRWFGIVLSVWIASTGLAQTVSRQLNANSSVDWQRLVIRSSGNSALANRESTDAQRIDALENARLSAEANLLEAAKAVRFDARSQVMQALARTNRTAADLRNIVKQFTIVDTRSMSDMTLEVDVELPLTGQLVAALLPSTTGAGELRISDVPICPVCNQPWPQGKPVPAGIELIIPSQGYVGPGNKPFSGLVIDARDLELSPAMIPIVLDQDSSEVYGIGYVNRQAAVNLGIVGFRAGLDAALRDARVGPTPMLVRALRLQGSSSSDIVVSNSDAVLIHAAARSQNFLRECKVIIVVS